MSFQNYFLSLMEKWTMTYTVLVNETKTLTAGEQDINIGIRNNGFGGTCNSQCRLNAWTHWAVAPRA